MAKNIFIIGFDNADLPVLQRLPGADQLRFHSLVDLNALRGRHELPVQELLVDAERKLTNFGGSIDGIVTFIDFPATEMVPILAEKFGTRAPTLESVLKCNHKYWSRLLQSEVCPGHVPKFVGFNPYDEDPLAMIDLDYPYWIKPVNSFRSHLGFRINNELDFAEALPSIRSELPRLAEPLEHTLEIADLPSRIDRLDPHMCIAESIIFGSQCTVEGYVFDGEPRVYGVVDSVRAPNRMSFSRYQYPSQLPQRVQKRMAEIAEKVIAHVGLDNTTFNMEFFYNQRTNRIWILEINPRLSHSHCELFEKVDGMSHQKVMMDIALGREPEMPHREGEFNCAAKFFVRAYADATIQRVPTAAEIKRVEREVPGTHVVLEVEKGTRLSDMENQESYSFELAVVYVGSDSPKELRKRYRQCRDMLHFEFTKKEVESREVSHLAPMPGS